MTPDILWQPENSRLSYPQLVAQMGHDWVRAVAFSPDGRQVLTGSQDDVARLWDTATGQLASSRGMTMR